MKMTKLNPVYAEETDLGVNFKIEIKCCSSHEYMFDGYNNDYA